MNNDTLKRWERCLEIIRDNLSETQFTTWFAPIRPLSMQDGELTIEVPTQFFCEFLEEHFLDIMCKAIEHAFGKGTQLMYRVKVDSTSAGRGETQIGSPDLELKNASINPSGNKTPQVMMGLNSQLNPKYNFDNFIEGSCNKLSRTVAQAVAEDPAHTPFNPLFIYGPSGVGKTHLVNAVGSRIKEQYPEKRVLYLSAHLFMVQYSDSVRNNTIPDFMNFYQSIDVLIMDDIQEIAGRTATQNTFFHIFNHLHQNGKQLILTADRTPAQMQGFEDRMLTRFKWGMLAELERPNEDLRKAIILKKIKRDGLRIPMDVVDFISSHVNQSVRDLEGIVNSLMAYSVVYNCDVNMELAMRVVSRVARIEKHEVTVEEILRLVNDVFGVSQEDIFSRSRKRPIAMARQTAMYLTQKYTDMPLARIGAEIGRRDHATVVHSIKQIKDLLTVDQKLAAQVRDIETAISR